MPNNPLDVPAQQLRDFAQRWKVSELALFGSALRPDYQPSSDVDVLVSFAPNAAWNLFDLTTMREELAEIFGRPVDLVEEAALRNPFRRKSILDAKQIVYAA